MAGLTETSVELANTGNSMRDLLQQYGPTCPCAFAYFLQKRTLPAQWLVNGSHTISGFNEYRVAPSTLGEGERGCPICLEEFSVTDFPVRTKQCKNLIGEECLRLTFAVPQTHRECFAKDYNTDALKGCPLCREQMLYYPVSGQDQEFDPAFFTDLVKIFDTITIQFSAYHPPDNALVYVHSDMKDAGRVRIVLEDLAEQCEIEPPLCDDDEFLLETEIARVVDYHQGSMISINALVTLLHQAIAQSPLVQRQYGNPNLRLPFFQSAARLWILKWWMACHITHVMNEFNKATTDDDRTPSSFGTDVLAFGCEELPLLCEPFSSMHELEWLNTYTRSQEWSIVDLLLQSNPDPTYRQHAADMATTLTQFRSFVQRLYTHDTFSDATTIRLTLHLQILQSSLHRLRSIAYQPLADEINRRSAGELHPPRVKAVRVMVNTVAGDREALRLLVRADWGLGGVGRGRYAVERVEVERDWGRLFRGGGGDRFVGRIWT